MFSTADFIVGQAIIGNITSSFVAEAEKRQHEELEEMADLKIIMETFIPREIK